MITRLVLAWIILPAEVRKAADERKELEVRAKGLEAERDRLQHQVKALTEIQARLTREAETPRAKDDAEPGLAVDIAAALIEPPPPAYVLCTDGQCMNWTGWGEAGNQGRSVRFVNDWNPHNRYYLRIFIDGEEAVLTDGLGVFETVARTKHGPRSVSLLGPNGQGLTIVNEGEHRMVVERYLGPAPYQYIDTCVWNQDFDGNLGLNQEYHFWVGACSKIGQASFE